MSAFAVQVAIMAALNADAVLPPVYDRVPADVERPYGSFGPPNETPERRFATSSSRVSVLLDWWGNERDTDPATGRVTVHGNRQIAGFAKQARALLDGTLLPLSDGRMVRLRWEQDVYVPDPDDTVRHVQQRFTVGVVQ